MFREIQQWLKDNNVRQLLISVLSEVANDKKLTHKIPNDLIDSDNHRVPGSPFHFRMLPGHSKPTLMNDYQNGPFDTTKYSLSQFNAMIKQAKSDIRSYSDRQKHEAQKQQEDIKEAKKLKQEQVKKINDDFYNNCGLETLEANNTKAIWCSELNKFDHRDGTTYKHHEQFNDIPEPDYLQKAKELADKAADGVDIWGYACYFEGNIGTICRYDTRTHEYVKMNNQGLSTFYILDYGDEQYRSYVEADQAIIKKGGFDEED